MHMLELTIMGANRTEPMVFPHSSPPLLLPILWNLKLAKAKAKASCESLGPGPTWALGPLGPWTHLARPHLGPGQAWARSWGSSLA